MQVLHATEHCGRNADEGTLFLGTTSTLSFPSSASRKRKDLGEILPVDGETHGGCGGRSCDDG